MKVIREREKTWHMKVISVPNSLMALFFCVAACTSSEHMVVMMNTVLSLIVSRMPCAKYVLTDTRDG